ncbi:MAG: ribonuclease III, partial [Oscillospiraceae bacterium]
MKELEAELDYTFKNSALLENALTHSSYANEHKGG